MGVWVWVGSPILPGRIWGVVIEHHVGWRGSRPWDSRAIAANWFRDSSILWFLLEALEQRVCVYKPDSNTQAVEFGVGG